MNCLRNSRSVLSRLHRKAPAVSPPLRSLPAQARYYYASRVPHGNAASRTPRTPPRVPSHCRSLTSPRAKLFPFWQKLEPVLIVGGSALAIYLSVVEFAPFTNRPCFILISRRLERGLGEGEFARDKRLMWHIILPQDHPDTVRVRRIASGIIGAVDRGLADHRSRETGARAILFRMDRLLRRSQASSLLDGWDVIVVKDKRIDAKCSPGGKIIVYTGLLEKCREDAEIATLLGREIGHAIARHTAEVYGRAMVLFILYIVTLQFLYRPDLSQALSMFDRMTEVEADHIGLLLLAAAGYDPRVAPGVYEKLGKHNGEDGGRRSPTIDDHPLAEERVRFLSQPDVMNEALDLYRGVHAAQGTIDVSVSGFDLFSYLLHFFKGK